MKAGLLLLSGGSGARMGAAKHGLAHPEGGTWGGHLVRVFEAVFPGAPILILGAPLPDWPHLEHLDDPREGPAMALQAWAATAAPEVDRWWLVGCDQVRWTPERLRVWAAACQAADPMATRWIMALHQDHLQPLGSWLPHPLRPILAATKGRSLLALVASLPHLALPQEGPEWLDVDTPEERDAFEEGG